MERKTIFVFIFCFSWLTLTHAEPIPGNKVQNIIDTSTITRTQKPLAVRTDSRTLEYFINHVEELTKHGRDFSRKELILEVKGVDRYGIQIPSKHITGEFELVERSPCNVIYLGHGNATTFFNFSGSIVLVVDYTTQNDTTGTYENVTTTVHLKFDNIFLAVLAKAAIPILNHRLDNLINKFSTKTKKVVEAAYAQKKTAQ